MKVNKRVKMSDRFSLQKTLEVQEKPSRSAKKRECTSLQKIGEELIKLTPEERSALGLPEELENALQEYDKIRDKEAARRQRQYIGKVMRSVNIDDIEKVLISWKNVKSTETIRFKNIEKIRSLLINSTPEDFEKRLAQIMEQHISIDQQYLIDDLRHLAIEARKEMEHGAKYKKLFRFLSTIIK